MPDAEETFRFWSDIWDNGGQHHNNEAEWLRNLKEETHKAVLKQGNVGITAEKVDLLQVSSVRYSTQSAVERAKRAERVADETCKCWRLMNN